MHFRQLMYQSIRYSTIENMISLCLLASYKKLIEAKKNACYIIHYENIAAEKMR